MESVLTVSNLRVLLDGKTLFENLSFSLEEGQTLVILGPNGAGKTVLLRTLLGLQSCSGDVQWKAPTALGYVPQRVPLLKDMPLTVADFFALKAAPSLDIPEALRTVGISEAAFQGKQLGLLSSGQFQRVLVAWALASHPQVLLVDEPLAGVDAGGEETIYALLRRLQEQTKLSIILVTHDLSVVPNLAHHVLCLNGRNFCYGEPHEVLTPKVLRDIYGQEARFFEHAHG